MNNQKLKRKQNFFSFFVVVVVANEPQVMEE
jgi:hypothetical protein